MPKAVIIDAEERVKLFHNIADNQNIPQAKRYYFWLKFMNLEKMEDYTTIENLSMVFELGINDIKVLQYDYPRPSARLKLVSLKRKKYKKLKLNFAEVSPNHVKKFIKEKRMENGWTRRQFATTVGIGTETINKIERGEPSYIRPKTIQRLCSYFNCLPCDVITLESKNIGVDTSDVHQFIRIKRAEMNMTITDFAAFLGMSPKEISKIERGMRTKMSMQTLMKIQKIFGASFKEITKYSEKGLTITPLDLGKFIKQKRSLMGWSKIEFERQTGICRRSVTIYESGQGKQVKPSMVSALLSRFQCFLEDISGFSKSTNKNLSRPGLN